MKRKNASRNALFTSIISLLLCVSMLVGTTFAWFTDEVKSGVNNINAGNLDVELLRDNVAITEQDKLFLDCDGKEIARWEPGVVAFTNVQVANVGDLALKYQLTINATNENETLEGGYKLSQVLKIALVEGGVTGTTREAVLAEAERANPVSLSTFTVEEPLYPANSTLGDTVSETYGLVVFWSPNDNATDNLYNLNNGRSVDDVYATTDQEPLHIELGVNLFATQLNAESDSFGPDYDKPVWDDAMVVLTEDELNAAIAAGETKIQLEDDIALTKPLEIPANTNLALNLNGNRISGAFDKNSSAMIINKGTLTIEGGTIENTTVNGNAVIRNEGTLTLNGAKIVGAPIADGGYPAYALDNYGKLTVNAGSAITSDRGALYMNNGSDVVINGGNITVTDALGSRTLTAHVIYAYGSNSKLTIKDGTFALNYAAAGNTGASVICPAGATIDVYGGEFTYAGVVGQSGIFQNYMGYGAPVNVYGGTYNDTSVQKNLAVGYKAVDNGNGTWTVLKGEAAVKNSEELAAAINEGKQEIALAAGNYVMPDGFSGVHDTYNQNGYDDGLTGVSLQNKSLTLNGSGNVVIDAKGIDTRDQFVTGANLTFNGVTVNFGTENYMGFANVASLTYKNSTTNGKQCLMGNNVAFENCDLNSNGAEHAVWTYGAKNVTFTDCDFTYGDRGINCYKDQDIEGGKQTISFEDCTFTATNAASLGAVEINSQPFSVGIDVTMNGCTAPANGEMVYVSEYDSTAGAKTNITVDGKPVHVVLVGNQWATDEANADALKAALSAEREEIDIVLLKNIAIDIGTGWKMGGASTKAITIDGNGKTLTLSSTYRSYFNLANPDGKLVLKDMTLTNAHTGTHFFDYTTHFNCDVEANNIKFAKSPLVSGATAVFTDCEFSQAGTDIYGLWIMSGSNVTVNGGELKTDRGFKITDEDSAEKETILKVSGTKFNNTKKAAILVTTDYGAKITLDNLDISNCTADSTNAVWIDDGRTATADKIVVTGGSVITEP